MPKRGVGSENKQGDFFFGTPTLTLKKKKYTLALTVQEKKIHFLSIFFSSLTRVTWVTLKKKTFLSQFLYFFTLA